ncbi:mechanosensitive ion channel family protein [Candidatus Sumerlaeota bacterium]|nr:mechanosensitive ion channel family protein [Candidatus Sumerlaeota bacterium]
MSDTFEIIHGFLLTKFLDNSIKDYVISIAIIVLGIAVIRFIKKTAMSRLKTWAEKTKTDYDDFFIYVGEKNLIPLCYFGVVYIGIRGLSLHPVIGKTIRISGITIFTYLAVKFLIAFVEFVMKKHWLKNLEPASSTKVEKTFPAIRISIWILGTVFLLDNLGFQISTVIATLGIGGVAVALAAQAILKDLFSYFAILFDRPFEPGDFIIIGDFMGTIEHVGIKTTRIRSLSGEQLVFSNSDLTDSRIRNYKRMARRRVVFKIGVTYQTTQEQVESIPGIIKSIIDSIEMATLDRVHFASFGDFSLVFEIVYYVESSEYNIYMDIQQQINFKLKHEFEARSIEFAYPTQSLFLTHANNPLKEAVS